MIKKIKVDQILSKVKKDLNRVRLQASRCVINGLENSVKLKVSTKEEIAKYTSLLENGSQVNKYEQPWTNILVFNNAPARAHIKAEGKQGSIKIKLAGDVPADLVICISEQYSDATEHNSTWVKKHPTVVCFHLKPKDLRFLGS